MDDDQRLGDVVGRIERRLLVNQWVDPDEAEAHLPHGVRPRLGANGGVVVGCCMIEIDSARPWPLPSAVGVSIRAAAHRISVEAGPEAEPTPAVWVPVRHTDSRSAVLAGGRVFPGVHGRADVSVDADRAQLAWSIAGADEQGAFDIRARAAVEAADAADRATCEVADTVIGTVLGLSPGRRPDRVEAVEMTPEHQHAAIVELGELDSSFMSSFSSAIPAETLLMTDVNVVWRRATVPPTDSR